MPEDRGTLRDPGMDEGSLAGLDLAEALVDDPLVHDKLLDFGLVRESFREAGLLFFLLLLVLFLQPFQPS